MSQSIYKYCVYLTEYKGTLLPSYYVGSSSVDRVESGYRGSVKSKQYKDIWESELISNSDMFVTSILSYHQTRKDALECELQYQLQHDVVRSPLYINKSLASPNGYFGMDVSGENNPMYGTTREGEKHKGGENISNALKELYKTEWGQIKKNQSSELMSKNNPSKDKDIIESNKLKWKESCRNVGSKNGMYGKKSPMYGKKLYNNGVCTKAYVEGEQPDGWVLGRHRRVVI